MDFLHKIGAVCLSVMIPWPIQLMLHYMPRQTEQHCQVSCCVWDTFWTPASRSPQLRGISSNPSMLFSSSCPVPHSHTSNSMPNSSGPRMGSARWSADQKDENSSKRNWGEHASWWLLFWAQAEELLRESHIPKKGKMHCWVRWDISGKFHSLNSSAISGIYVLLLVLVLINQRTKSSGSKD